MNIHLSAYLKIGLLLLAVSIDFMYINATDSNKTIESVLSEFDHADSSKQKKIAVRLFELLNREDFFDEPYSFPQSWPADSLRAEVWNCAAYYYFDRQEYNNGIESAHKALALLQKGKNTEITAECMSCLSLCYFRISDYANAIKYGKAVLEIDKNIGDKSAVSSDLNNLAAIYLASKRPDEALSFALKALHNSKATGDSLRIAIRMGMISEIYQTLGDHNNALSFAEQAYRIDLKQGRVDKVAIRLCQMAAPLFSMKLYDKAENCLLRALPELKKSGNIQSYSIACNQLGSLALAQNDHSKAAMYFNMALPFFSGQGDFFNESKTREGLYKTLKQSDPALATEHLERLCLLKDSLYSREMQDAVSEYNAKYKNEELRLKYEYEGRQRNSIVKISVLTMLLAISVIVLLLYINRQRKQKIAIVKQSELMRANFFTNITHEFRTPLTVLLSAAQEIIRRSPENSETLRNASDIMRHGRELLNLINQLLDIAKMTSAKMPETEWKYGNIVEFIKILCESHGAYASENGVELVYAPQEECVEMNFNPDCILKIVQNLISNAVKFSKPGDKVIIITKVKNRSFQMCIRDEGLGMTAEQKENIFKPFYQAPGESFNIGTGIGLPLVKLAVEIMKGDIKVFTAPGEGTEYIITLPMDKTSVLSVPSDMSDYYCKAVSETAKASMPTDDSCDTKGDDSDVIHILIIEDNMEVAQYMKRQLNPEYRYYFATNGNEGLEKAKHIVPDLIITDVMMPGMDGFELCRLVRASELLNHIPVIMVTARATMEDRLRGLEAGADAYLEKPFHADELYMRVEKLLELRQLLLQKYTNAVKKGEEPDISFMSEVSKTFIAKFTDAVRCAIEKGKIDYDALAYDMCMSRANLNRKIKSITGFSTTDFILHVRINHAKQLLDTTDESISDIAAKCGMGSDSYFCTIFKKATGTTPLQYKKRNR